MTEEEIKAKDRVIDFSDKKTELEWQNEIQDISEKATAAWFKWVGWMFAIGGMSYLADKTDSSLLEVFESISLLLLTLYFMMFFTSIRIEPYHTWTRNRKTRLGRLIAFSPIAICSALLFTGSKEIIDTVVELVKASK